MIVKAAPEPDLGQPDGVYFNQPGVAVVKWDPSLKAVSVTMKGWANPTEFQKLMEAGLHALTDHRGSNWLVNGPDLKVIQQSDQDWTARDWFPRALAAGLRRMAVVIAKSGLAQMNIEQMLTKIPSSRLDVGYFATVEEARDWLTSPRTLHPNPLGADRPR